MSTEALALSAAELGYLAEQLGGRFPGLVTAEPTDPSVPRELQRRGVLDADGAVAGDGARTVLRGALTGDALTLAACDGIRACAVTFFAAGRAVIRYETDDAERHMLELVARDAAREHLDEIVRAVAGAEGDGLSAARVTLEQLSEAARLVARGEQDRALAVLPEAPEYVAALGDVRLLVTVSAQARRGDELHATTIDIMHSQAHGLWMLESFGDGEVALRRVSSADLAARMEAVLDDLVAPTASA